jgi:cytosine/adenosine deaminase-related metal-dependent hydrolase
MPDQVQPGVRGAVNAHTHIYSGLAPLGMPSPDHQPGTFVEILEQIWWRLDRGLDAASLRASARLYVAEALLAGTTTLIDHHESPNLIEGSLDIIADACDELGIRALLCYGATERNGGRTEARAGLAECRRFITGNDRPCVRGVVGLHASFTVSDETIREAAALCQELGTVLHVHLAEAASDVSDAQERGYAGPLERLLDLGALPPGSLLAHGVHLDQAQVRRASEHGLWFLQNPRSNHGNQVGYPAALAATDRVAIGTDGFPADLSEEGRFLRQVGSEAGDTPATLTARLAGGHRLIEELFPESNLDDTVETDHGIASRVVVGGRTVVEQGRLLGGDLNEIRTEAAQQASRLWGRMQAQAEETD